MRDAGLSCLVFRESLLDMGDLPGVKSDVALDRLAREI
jgi:hypothetical protein